MLLLSPYFLFFFFQIIKQLLYTILQMEMDKVIHSLDTSKDRNNTNDNVNNDGLTEHSVEYKLCIPILHLTHEMCCKPITNAIALLKLDVKTLSQKVLLGVRSGLVSDIINNQANSIHTHFAREK